MRIQNGMIQTPTVKPAMKRKEVATSSQRTERVLSSAHSELRMLSASRVPSDGLGEFRATRGAASDVTSAGRLLPKRIVPPGVSTCAAVSGRASWAAPERRIPIPEESVYLVRRPC